MIVADSNILVYLLVPGDSTADAERAYQRNSLWVAPPLWRSELRNALALYLRLGRLSLAEALTTAEKAEAIMLQHTYDVESSQVLTLATTSGCSAYDCEFVALADALGVRLYTADEQILKAFQEVAFPLPA